LLDLAQAAGAEVISTSVNWAEIEQLGPAPTGEWGPLDRLVAAVRARHLELRFQLTGFPNWARDPGQPGYATAPWLAPVAADQLVRWDAFVGRVARHFRGEVAYYEVWNEPNISNFWYPEPDPVQYANLLEGTYLAVKHADKAANVMFGALSRNDLGFFQQVYDALDEQFPRTAAADHHFFDILGVNPYTGDRSPTVNSPKYVGPDSFGLIDGNFLGFERLHAIMVQHGEGDKEVYLTEYGFTTVHYTNWPPVSDARRASYLRTAWSLATSVPYVRAFSWFCLYPTAYDPEGFAILQGGPLQWRETATYRALASVSRQAPG
jgi:hypothetical protein